MNAAANVNRCFSIQSMDAPNTVAAAFSFYFCSNLQFQLKMVVIPLKIWNICPATLDIYPYSKI